MIICLLLLGLSPKDQLTSAEDAYDSYDYARAIPQLERLLADPPKDAAIRQRARLILGFAQYLNKQEARARDALRELFKDNPDYPFDRDMHHPDLVRLYDAERKSFLEIKTIKVAPAKPETSKAAATPVIVRTETMGDRHPWLRIFPLGIGQFINHDYVGGGLFLGTELALIGMNIAGALWRQSMRVPGSADFREGTTPVTAQIIQDVGGLGAAVVAVIGIVDAFVWSPARGRSATTVLRTVDMGPLGDYRLGFAWTTSSSP